MAAVAKPGCRCWQRDLAKRIRKLARAISHLCGECLKIGWTRPARVAEFDRLDVIAGRLRIDDKDAAVHLPESLGSNEGSRELPLARPPRWIAERVVKEQRLRLSQAAENQLGNAREGVDAVFVVPNCQTNCTKRITDRPARAIVRVCVTEEDVVFGHSRSNRIVERVSSRDLATSRPVLAVAEKRVSLD